MLPESLGNPQQNGVMPPAGKNGASGLAPWPKFDYQSISAYRGVARGQQNSPAANSGAGNAVGPAKPAGVNPATTNIGVPGGGGPAAPFDYRSLSAYGDLDRNQPQSTAPGKSSAGNAGGSPTNTPGAGNQVAPNSNGQQTPRPPAH
jgi:hypothetical protein